MIEKNILQPWLVCISAALFFFYEFIQLGMFNSISPELMRDFSINATQLGNLSAMYFYADVIFLFFAGILLDRFSVRTIILSAVLLCLVATLIFALSKSLWLASISHFAAGIGNAFCFLGCIKLCSCWFSARRMALIIGIVVTIAMIGGVFAQAPLTLLVQALGWRQAVLVDTALGVIILFIIWYFVYDRADSSAIDSKLPTLKLRQSIYFALANRQNWLGGIYTCLLNLPIFLLGALWGIMYLTQVQHITRAQASYVTMMIFIGTIVGSPLVGWFSDKIARRRLPMILGAIFSLITILAIMCLPHLTFPHLIILFLLLGFFTSTQIISYPAIGESNPKAITGTATGVASVLIMGGGAVFQPLFGWLMDLRWNHLVLNTTPIYSDNDYLRGMMILPIAFVIGLMASLFMRETHCQPYQ